MKNSLTLLVCFLVSVVLVGCSSTHTIRTKDGKEYTSSDEPDLTDDRFIKFRTTDGRKVLLKQDDVSSISED
jgi:hypothetical protein